MAELDATLPLAAGDSAQPLRSVGRFEILGTLGSGGMGIVLQARDPELDRKVALKVLHPSIATTDLLAREAQAMARLAHPNVVTVFEVGVVGETAFVAMELVEGSTLRGWLGEKPRGWREIVAMFAAAGRGLAAAHAAGLVHRDFKPDNVLIGSDGRARVTDFGLVADIEPERAIDQSRIDVTTRGTVAGSPAYMSPEHWAGAPDPQSDQFSFCVALWEALHGERPFAGTTAEELRSAVGTGRVSSAPRRGVPRWLERAVRRGLSADPAERWPNMQALLEELERRPVVRRRIGLAMLIAGGATALAVALVLAVRPARDACSEMDRPLAGIWDGERARAVRAAFDATGAPGALETANRAVRQLDAYTRTWVEARVSTCKATHVHGTQSGALLDLRMSCLQRRLADVDALVDVFVRIANAAVVDRAVLATSKLPSLEACNDVTALQAAIPPPHDPATAVVVAELRRRTAAARALGDAGRPREALDEARLIVRDAEAVGYAPVHAEALRVRGRLETINGDAAAADATFEQALLAAANARDDVLAATVWTDRLHAIGVGLMRPDDALRLRAAVEAAVRRAGANAQLEAELAHHLGNVLAVAGRTGEAIEHFERAIAATEKTAGVNHPALMKSLIGLGYSLYDLGRYEDAIGHYTRARDIAQATFGPDHPEVATALNNLGNAFHELGNVDEAMQAHGRVLAIIAKTYGTEHPKVADSHDNLANALESARRFDEAKQHRELAYALRLRLLGPDHYDVGLSEYNLGGLLGNQKRFAEAEPYLRRALAIWEKGLGPKHPELADPLTDLAVVSIELGRNAEARMLAERALALRSGEDIDPAKRAQTQFVLARAMWSAGGRDRAQALALARAARDAMTAADARSELAGIEAWLARHDR